MNTNTEKIILTITFSLLAIIICYCFIGMFLSVIFSPSSIDYPYMVIYQSRTIYFNDYDIVQKDNKNILVIHEYLISRFPIVGYEYIKNDIYIDGINQKNVLDEFGVGKR